MRSFCDKPVSYFNENGSYGIFKVGYESVVRKEDNFMPPGVSSKDWKDFLHNNDTEGRKRF